MREFKVSEVMKPYLEKVLQRDRIAYVMKEDTICVDASGNRFHEAVEDAMCEKESRNGIPVYSFRTLTNPKKLERLQKLNGKTSYQCLSKDKDKIFALLIQ